MSFLRSAVKTNITVNLSDFNLTFYTDTDLNDSIQDAYDEVVLCSRCIIKDATLSWQSQLSYYDFRSLLVRSSYSTDNSDFLGCIGIFDNNTNRWLDDSLTLRELDKASDRWELDNGTPEYWIPVNHRLVCVYKKPSVGSGNFDLRYWGTATQLSSDSDSILIASDMQKLVENYVTADMLEQAEEFNKAAPFWEEYFNKLEIYTERCANIAKADILIRG